MPKLTRDQLHEFLEAAFPGVERQHEVDEVGERAIRVRVRREDRMVRPGGSIAGPVMMTLADTTMYLLVAAALGPAYMAVTSSLTIHFLRRPDGDRDLLADGRLLKLGRRLALGEVYIRSDGLDDIVAIATVSSALPPSPLRHLTPPC